ncbi:hypothetical protein ACHQM5_008924 [Ranunculus cassubicifolius]
MSTGELLNIDPQELNFSFELKKQISCSLQLSNKTDNHVAFKVKTIIKPESSHRYKSPIVSFLHTPNCRKILQIHPSPSRISSV